MSASPVRTRSAAGDEEGSQQAIASGVALAITVQPKRNIFILILIIAMLFQAPVWGLYGITALTGFFLCYRPGSITKGDGGNAKRERRYPPEAVVQAADSAHRIHRAHSSMALKNREVDP